MINFRTKYTLYHLSISALIALFSAAIVFYGWFPNPYNIILNVGNIYLILIVVDVICGPLLTSVVANPKKSKRSILSDIALIGLLQFTALIYGLYSLYKTRPVITVFEVDRIVLVTANEVTKSRLNKAIPTFSSLPHIGTLEATTRAPRDSQELVESIDLSLAGVPPSQRPDWWLPYDINEISKAVIPISTLKSHLKQKNRNDLALLNRTLIKYPSASYYLPFTTTRRFDWIILFDSKMQKLTFLNIDGFITKKK